jgi:acetyl/propionyl-CoA carboxylase alpha subunit
LKVEIVIDGRAAKLEYDGAQFHYQPADSDPIDREYSISPLAPGSYSVLVGGRSFEVVANGRGEIIVDGRAFAIDVFDPREMRGRTSTGVGEGRLNIAAMMPGKVVRILVAEGDVIEAGQGLVVVEAMKMQNEMKSPKPGRVVEMKTTDGATVAAGEILLVIE